MRYNQKSRLTVNPSYFQVFLYKDGLGVRLVRNEDLCHTYTYDVGSTIFHKMKQFVHYALPSTVKKEQTYKQTICKFMKKERLCSLHVISYLRFNSVMTRY